MKLHLLSDLHMEFAPFEITNPGADVLVLSGDILVAKRFTRSETSPYYAQAQYWINWFESVCSQYDRVYYILGNHEHYYGKFYETAVLLQGILGHIRNLVILDNAIDRYEDITFVGTTLWTDFDRDNFKAMMVKDGLNDYRCIEGTDYRKLQPANVVGYYNEALRLIEHACERWNKVVVLGHHAPSYQSISPEYATGRYAYLNPGYASHLDSFIEEHPEIALWTHGHVHSSWDYMIGGTRVVANPRGYATRSDEQENEQFDRNLILEV